MQRRPATPPCLPKSDRPAFQFHRVASLLVLLALTASVNAFGQGTVTTSDGLALSLSSSGSVSSLKLGTTNYAGSLPSGFYFREPSLSPSNATVNGSFESGSGTPSGWTISGGSGGSWTIDSGNASAGSRSMRVYIPGSDPTRSPDLFSSSNFPLAPNTPYRLSCSMKTSGLSGYLSVYLLQQDSSGVWTQTGIQSLTGTNGWQTYTATITTGPHATQGYLKAYISNGYGTAWVDDIQLRDVFGGASPVAFGGSVSSSSGTVTQTASKSGLNLSAQFTSVGSAIRVDATVTNTNGSDRGIELAFRLPLNVPGWTWDNDLATPQTIAAGTRYGNNDGNFGIQTHGHMHGMYPFATVHNSSAAFSLAVPMGPLVDRFAYDDSYGFRVVYDVGVSSSATLHPNKATVTFWIYTHSAKYGIRAAADRYFTLLQPDAFTSNATVHGAWALKNSKPLSSVSNPSDFGWGYEEGDTELSFDNAHNVVGTHYISLPEWDINISGYGSQPPYDVLVSTLNGAAGGGGSTVDGIPTSTMANAVISSSPYDESDHYQLSWNSYFWYGNRLQMYPVAAYPSISNGVYDLHVQYSVDNQIASAQDHGTHLDGIFLDNTTSVFGNVENYRKSVWAHQQTPLSFSYRTGETIQYNGDSMDQYLAALRTHLNGQGLVLMASLTPGSYVWLAPHIDVVGGEVAGAETLDRAYARRTLGYGKVWTNLYVPGSSSVTQDKVIAYLRQALLLGFFPGFNGSYWDSSSNYNRDRSLFQQYVPLIRTISQAGWTPINYATASNSTTLLERFGKASDGTFFVTAQNSDASSHSVQITLDGAGLGISPSTSVSVTEMLSGGSRTATRSGSDIVFSESLDAGETTVYSVDLGGGGGGGGTLNVQFTWSPSNPTPGQPVQFTDQSSGSPTSWLWDFGDGATSTSKNPTHTFAAAGEYRVKLTASNSSGSGLGEHTVTAGSGGAPPNAQYTFGPSNPMPGQSIQFTDQSSGSPTSWSWDFGDGHTTTSHNPTHSYSAAGQYRVKLTASNANGSSLAEHTVTVAGMPTAQFTWNPQPPVHGHSTQFIDQSTNVPTSWYWDFGDGHSSTAQNPSHTYSSAGTYRVSLTSTNSHGSDVGEHTVVAQ